MMMTSFVDLTVKVDAGKHQKKRLLLPLFVTITLFSKFHEFVTYL